MSKESAAAILVQTLFTSDTAMQHLVMSHAKLGEAKPEEVAKFIVPYYAAMLKAMEGGDAANSEQKAEPENESRNARQEDQQAADAQKDKQKAAGKS